MQTAKLRFFDKVAFEPNSGCWLWLGAVNWKGYGAFWFDGKFGKAYRFAYRSFRGPIQDGFQIDHLCRTRCCVNPYHLDLVTQRENNLRSPIIHAGACPKGHSYTPENTLHVLARNGKREWRRCRTCRHEQDKKYRIAGLAAERTR